MIQFLILSQRKFYDILNLTKGVKILIDYIFSSMINTCTKFQVSKNNVTE